MNTKKLDIISSVYKYLYNMPFVASSAVKLCRGGSRVTETLTSLWHSFGGISLNVAGVATRDLCSSKVGKDEVIIRIT
jgi:hypothetical protein